MDAARALWVARRRSGLTQGELARRVGVSLQTVSRIERGAVVPALDTLDRLLAGCGSALCIRRRERRDLDRSEIGRLLSLPSRVRISSALVATADALAWHRVRYILVGATAARLHGAPIPSRSLEIVLDRGADNARRLEAAGRHRWMRAPIVLSGGSHDELLPLAGYLPWRPVPPPRRVLNAVINSPTGFLASLEDLIDRAGPAHRALLHLVAEEREARRRGIGHPVTD